MKKKFLIIFISVLMAMLMAIGLACCSDGGQDPPPDDDPPTDEEPTPSSFGFVEKRIEIVLGDTRQLSLAALEEGEVAALYSSNDENIVTVDENGLIEGVGIGSAVVKATTTLGRTALAQITVHDPEFYPIPYITVSKDAISLNIGDSFALDYTLAYQGEVLGDAVTITSSNTAAVTVDSDVLTAVGNGKADVVLSATTSFGTATRTVQVTVLEPHTEFFLSVFGKNIFVDKPMTLEAYVMEDGKQTDLKNVTFSVEDTSIAMVDGNKLIPKAGGDTSITYTFTYNGKSESQSQPIHVYGYHTCTVRLVDGTTDSIIEKKLYGDFVPLELANEEGNPEYRKKIKSWYANGEKVTGEVLVMPDEDVDLTAVFINEAKDDFTDAFTPGHLLNDLSSAKVGYISGEPVDGVDSYVKVDCPSWSSVNFYFDETVTVNAFSTVKLKLYLAQEAAIVYFGFATSESNPSSDDTKSRRYDIGRDNAGVVPFMKVDYEKWIEVELPLPAFVEAGQSMEGISICVSSNSYILIDYISVNYGLSATDPEYQDKVLYKAILAEENGSTAQANAIQTYYSWAVGLSEGDRNSATHQQNVAAIKAIIVKHFDSKIETQYDNIPKATGDVFYTGDQKDGPEDRNKHTKYASRTYEHFYMTQVDKADYNATFIFNKFAYNNYGEVSFGFFVSVGSTTGIISFAGKEITIDNSIVHYYKVVIKDGMLTVYVDNQGLEPVEVLTTALSDAILNGEEELVFSVDFGAWSQVESTEMYMSISADDIK